ncbi:MAG: YggS family pyridoxal phosphate-dependent enzyme [Fimbriimonadaceae bacterium]|nr:YggS family pyridoxal phosphate-dependent enzyme [Fimbriimonadaceae bacterium]QYK54902.1 MAG: YggS family pyridoxal phosphate-dependent enzyme [Fimbriimonadaceae bacterium]
MVEEGRFEEIRERLAAVEARVADACRTAGRPRDSVTLVAVTKTVSAEDISVAYALGLRDFGESRLQEALTKIDRLPADVRWHFIGRLQSNKAKKVGQVFTAVHTLENESQLRELAKSGRTIDGLIEVNVGREEQKAGVLPETLDRMVQRLLECKDVRYRGLMTIGPLADDAEQSRKVFRELARLGRSHNAEWLSMGMSADLHVAIQEGATHVRVGSAIFGER